MNKKYLPFAAILYFFVSAQLIFSQEIPPIQTFSPDKYNAGNQNWMISQDSNKNIYTANNEGLLVYNGSKWKLYQSPNKTIFRSVKVIKDLIYTGCFMDFGYWEKDELGILNYHSLVPLLEEKMIEDEQIWNIIDYDKWIIFQSFNRMYIYDLLSKKINIFNSKNRILKIFKIEDDIYYQEFNKKIFRLEEGNPSMLIDSEKFKDVKVVNIFKRKNDLIFLTSDKGFFIYKNKKLTKWEIPANDILKETTVFSAIELKNKNFVLGTISKGIITINNKGNVVYQFNQRNGLSNNTVLSLFTDVNENLWAGLDNGVNVINIKSPITIFNDDKGILGTVYCSIIHNGYLYLGTNQGLFYKKQNSKNPFKFIIGTKGQVWSLVQYNKELFCGHNLGIFIIKNNVSQLIAPVLGTWDIKPIPNVANSLLLGTFNGLYVIAKKDNKWLLKNKIEGFDISSRFFEFTSKSDVWVSHEYKGLYRVSINEDYSTVTEVRLDTVLPKGKNSSIISYKNQLLYAFENGIYKYDKTQNTFKKDTLLSATIEGGNYISGKLVVDKKDKLWTFSKKHISYIAPSKLINELKVSKLSIPSIVRKEKIGYENISIVGTNKYLLGTSNGYLKINLSNITEKENEIFLSRAYIKNIDFKDVDLSLAKVAELNNSQNSIGFDFSVPEYDKFILTEYQYKLDGLHSKWSSWTDKPSIYFENLKHNDYSFSVRARVGNKLTTQKDFKFSIKRPWHLSTIAILVYLLTLMILLYLIHRISRWYYNKQHNHKQLTNEQLIMSMKNQQLNQDIEGKNRELAISTMSIIKKNKVLSSVKKELSNNMTSSGVKAVIKLIDRNLNNEKDWKFFEEAFNNADKDFLKKLKNVHPKLTPNDLRFCAYLRLNLSSKEIAPLLNISVRSIEIKRYRLRKKMSLEHSESLVKHILDL